MHYKSVFAALVLPVLVAAHFEIVFPTPRGTDDDNEPNFPCGGYAQTQNRTLVPLTGFPVSLSLEHTATIIQVLLAVGTNPGTAFNTVIYPTISETGPGSYCFKNVSLPASLGLKDGTNATIQVVTGSIDDPGLYMCADIQFSSAASISSVSCTNQTGVQANYVANGVNANSTSSSSSNATTTKSGTTSATSSAASASGTSKSGAENVVVQRGIWGLVGMGVLGGLALL